MGRAHCPDTPEYATGHGVAADWELVDGHCHMLRTTWIPRAEVEKTKTVDMPDVVLSMDQLGALADVDAVRDALAPLAQHYQEWLKQQREDLNGLTPHRPKTANEQAPQLPLLSPTGSHR